MFVPDREVHGVCLLCHRVRLHGGALPDDDPEHGHRQLQHRRQGRRNLRPPRLAGENRGPMLNLAETFHGTGPGWM